MRAMQQWLDRFCYKHPRLSIPGLMRYIVIGNVLVFLLDLFSTGGYPIATSLLSFSSDAILQGQIWRIITFVFVPATSRNIFLFAITLSFYSATLWSGSGVPTSSPFSISSAFC